MPTKIKTTDPVVAFLIQDRQTGVTNRVELAQAHPFLTNLQAYFIVGVFFEDDNFPANPDLNPPSLGGRYMRFTSAERSVEARRKIMNEVLHPKPVLKMVTCEICNSQHICKS